jgi:predicted ATPase/class 3 adenylate cyclase
MIMPANRKGAMTAEPGLPRGTVTFLFTDIEGSTALWESDRAAMPSAVARHYDFIGEAARKYGGHLFKRIGDAAQIAFATVGEALAAAVAAQRSLAAEPWPGASPLQVRMALHTGEATPDSSGDYNQVAALNRLSRLLAIAHGGQILVTHTTRALAGRHLPVGISLRDLGEYRLRDLQQPERIWQVVAPGLRAGFPEIRGTGRQPTNLRPQPNPLFGREDDIARIRAMIELEQARLVTLTGPGGTGKTRLALAVAAELRDAFPDGVWFVDLATLADPALVESTLAATLGVRESSGRPLRDALFDVLAGRRVLLVMDNFEHLLAAATLVSELLHAGPGVVVLATSREPLRLRHEREVAVTPLSLPDPDRLPGPEVLAQNPAVALFVDRAQATKPDFALNEANAAAVSAICLRLDGLPLAIELAAARVRLLPPQALLARLSQRLPVLTGGPRDAPARQRTLRDAIAWSHDLLDADEQAIFRRLGVFSGGCSLEAVEVIADRGEGLDILSGLTSLTDKSLIQHTELSGQEVRFTLLETIREFALEQLQASGEVDLVRCAHAAWSLKSAAAWRGQIWGPRQWTVQQRAGMEAGNFRATLEWFFEQGDIQQAAELAIALVDFWYLRSQFQEATEWLERIHLRVAELPPAVAAAITSRLATFLQPQADDERAAALAERAVQMHRQLRCTPDFDAHELAFALFVASASQTDPTQQANMLEEALTNFRALGDKAWIGHTLSNLAMAMEETGESRQAIALAEEAAVLQSDAQNEWGLSLAKMNLAEIWRLNGNAAAAMRQFQEALRIAQDSKDLWHIANCLQSLVAIVSTGEQARAAAQLLGTANRLRARYGAIRESELWDFEPELAGEIRGAVGDLVFTEAFTSGMDAPLDEIVALALSLPAESLTPTPGRPPQSPPPPPGFPMP